MPLGVQVSDRVDVQALLQTAVVVPASLRKAVYFVDTDEVPLDRRLVEVTKSDFGDTLDSTGYPYAFANLHFSQKRKPQSLQIARWAQTASNPLWVAGDHETDLATWAAITDGSIRIVDADTPANYDDVVAIDFSSMTNISQLPTVLTNAVQAVTTPNVVGLDTAVWSYDLYGRLLMTMPDTGADAIFVTMEAVAPASGTDLVAVLDATNATSVEGIDAESIGDAIDALRAIDDTGVFYTAKFTTASDVARAAELTAMAAKVEALPKFAVFAADDTDIKDTSVTSDIASVLQALGYKRTMGIYYESISDRPLMIPEAALLGCVIPGEEGTVSYNDEDLTGVSQSGFVSALSKAQRDVVTSKGFNVIEAVAGFTYLYDGLTIGGEELRIMVGRDWFVNTIASAAFTYKINSPLNAFDNETIAAMANIVLEAGTEAIRRRILVDTVDRPFLVTPPDADDFTQAQRASHYMQLPDFFSGYLNSSVSDYQILGTWTV